MMVSAVLLLIVAADLLVNGPGMEPAADAARATSTLSTLNPRNLRLSGVLFWKVRLGAAAS